MICYIYYTLHYMYYISYIYYIHMHIYILICMNNYQLNTRISREIGLHIMGHAAFEQPQMYNFGCYCKQKFFNKLRSE